MMFIEEDKLSLEDKYELSEDIEEPYEFQDYDFGFVELEEMELEDIIKNCPEVM